MNRLLFAGIMCVLAVVCSGNSFSQQAESRGDPIVIQIVELDHADAEELAKVLQPFLSKDGRITAYGPSNSLIIKDRKSIVEALVKVIKGKLANEE